MRIWYSVPAVQLTFLLIVFGAVLAFTGCTRSRDELPVTPPETHPLAREYIGFGVITASFTHILGEPDSNALSQGYLRRGAVVRILERRQVLKNGAAVLWVLAEGNYREEDGSSRGWLEEASVEIYESERQADTASRSMNQ